MWITIYICTVILSLIASFYVFRQDKHLAPIDIMCITVLCFIPGINVLYLACLYILHRLASI